MIYELFSQRRRKEESKGAADVYQYDNVPNKLRVQMQQILNDAIGPQYLPDAYSYHTPAHNPDGWRLIHNTLCREKGCHRIVEKHYSIENEGVLNFIGSADVEGFLDALELCGRVIERVIGSWHDAMRSQKGITQSPASALEEINYRLRESGLGYQYEDGEIIRVDSQYAHEEIVKPALRVLKGSKFEGAQSEFLEAHRYYRAGDFQQSIVSAGKAFESALKTVCSIKGWKYENGARASDLLKIVRGNGLWPQYLDGSFDQLLATLSSGLPKLRNDAGAHGQGPELKIVPSYVAGYALHLSAAKIIMMSEAAYTN